MTTTLRCRWTGTATPRALVDRHEDECTDETCRGCLRCPRYHCQICGIEHVDDQVCPSCLGTVRTNLHEVIELYLQLAHHAVVGANEGKFEAAREMPGGEATVMRSPWTERGEAARGDHMTTEQILVTWEIDWRSIKGTPTDEIHSLADAWTFLTEQLSWAAVKHPAFSDFAQEIDRHRNHLEDVLHAGERVETGAPCEVCRQPLERVWAKDEAQDRWWCDRCKKAFDPAEYVEMVSKSARKHKTWLTSRDMEIEHGVPRGTVTGWATAGKVRKHRDVNLGRMVYNVGDVLAQRRRDTQDETA